MTWLCLIFFCAGLTGSVLATPWVVLIARQLGAIDKPDGFRKAHRGATPRMGGLAVAFGFLCAIGLCLWLSPMLRTELISDFPLSLCSSVALLLVLVIGMVDDVRGLGAMSKLLMQAGVALLLYHDGFSIERVYLFGGQLDFGTMAIPVTVFWFLACMNIWNLIDGMDGLASGVGMIVALTLLLAALALGHPGVAWTAAGLAGALAGFLLFNFAPARIFLGDTGSLFLGAMLGMLAIRGSLKSGMTVAILIPILAMGLPIVDTSFAIIRRWVRNLPWNVADHGHLHHRLLAFGLSQQQASLFFYSFTILLCAASLASIGLQSDSLPIMLVAIALFGMLVVFAARRDERQRFVADVRYRFQQRRWERQAACIIWEAIQRLPKCPDQSAVLSLAQKTFGKLGCTSFGITWEREGELALHRWFDVHSPAAPSAQASAAGQTQLRFTLTAGESDHLVLDYWQDLSANPTAKGEGDRSTAASIPLTIACRYLPRWNSEFLARLAALADQASSPTINRDEEDDRPLPSQVSRQLNGHISERVADQRAGTQAPLAKQLAKRMGKRLVEQKTISPAIIKTMGVKR